MPTRQEKPRPTVLTEKSTNPVLLEALEIIAVHEAQPDPIKPGDKRFHFLSAKIKAAYTLVEMLKAKGEILYSDRSYLADHEETEQTASVNEERKETKQEELPLPPWPKKLVEPAVGLHYEIVMGQQIEARNVETGYLEKLFQGTYVCSRLEEDKVILYATRDGTQYAFAYTGHARKGTMPVRVKKPESGLVVPPPRKRKK